MIDTLFAVITVLGLSAVFLTVILIFVYLRLRDYETVLKQIPQIELERYITAAEEEQTLKKNRLDMIK